MRLGLVDLPVERFDDGAAGAVEPVAGGDERALRFLQLRAHGARDRLAGLAEMLDHRLGARLERGVDDLRRALDAAGGAVGLVGDEVDDLLGALAEAVDERFAVDGDGVVDLVAGGLEALDHRRRRDRSGWCRGGPAPGAGERRFPWPAPPSRRRRRRPPRASAASLRGRSPRRCAKARRPPG